MDAEMKQLMTQLLEELQQTRKQNLQIKEDLAMLRKVFDYKVQKVTRAERSDAKLNEWRMRKLAKC